jgi:formate hydrogenlyase subunit 3/multisubunit Na+/H+ antiporter MnhD subunit
MALGMGMGVHVTWLGLSSDAGSFSTVGGLVLAVVSLIVGGAIYSIAYVARPASAGAGAALAGAGGGIFTGGEPLSGDSRLTAGDFSEIFLENWHSFFRWTNVDRVYLTVWGGLQAFSRWLGEAVSWMERNATTLVGVLAASVFAFVRWAAPGVQPLGRGVPLGPSAQVPQLLIAAVAVAVVALFFVSLVSGAKGKIPLWPCMLIVGGISVAGLMVANPWLRLGLLEAAALLTVMRVWFTARTLAAKITYLAVVLISAGTLIASNLVYNAQDPSLSRALLLTSVFVKLGAIPLFFWLLSLADELPTLVLGLIIAVVDMAAFGEFCIGVQEMPSALTPPALLLYAAAITSFLAALLMLTQRSLKRILVLSTVEDVGFLLLGVASVSVIGMQGAIIAAATHALAKALLFACLAAPEADGALESDPRALAARYPVSAFGFLFGMLAMLGIPPTIGFIGRWRLYSTALQISPVLLTIFILSSIFALIAYVLALTRNWWGPPYESAPPKGREPFVLRAVLVILVVVILAAGIWPAALQQFMGVAQ